MGYSGLGSGGHLAEGGLSSRGGGGGGGHMALMFSPQSRFEVGAVGECEGPLGPFFFSNSFPLV